MAFNRRILLNLKSISSYNTKYLIRRDTVRNVTRLSRIVTTLDQGLLKFSSVKNRLLGDISPQKMVITTNFSTDNSNSDTNIENAFNLVEYEKLVENTLQSLAEFIDEILESADNLNDTDVSLSDGILKVFLGEQYGTYVINKQTPNRQIWFSSPFSGPLRFDYVDNQWIYKRTGITLNGILSEEFSKVLEKKVEFPGV